MVDLAYRRQPSTPVPVRGDWTRRADPNVSNTSAVLDGHRAYLTALGRSAGSTTGDGQGLRGRDEANSRWLSGRHRNRLRHPRPGTSSGYVERQNLFDGDAASTRLTNALRRDREPGTKSDG